MAVYAVQFNRTASSTLGVGSFEADDTRPRRGELVEAILGSEATPADNAFLWTIDRVTAAGAEAGSAVTPSPIDPADVATEADALENLTINPTVGVNLAAIPLNQKATFRWVANPAYPLVYPATASNGFIFLTPTMTAVAISMTAWVNER